MVNWSMTAQRLSQVCHLLDDLRIFNASTHGELSYRNFVGIGSQPYSTSRLIQLRPRNTFVAWPQPPLTDSTQLLHPPPLAEQAAAASGPSRTTGTKQTSRTLCSIYKEFHS